VKLGNGVPVPLSATVWGEPLALSAIESVAVKLAADAGVNVTETVQLTSIARVVPQVVVCAKSEEFVPAIVTPVILMEALPVFVSVTICAALVVPEVAENVSDVGVNVAIGAGAAMPVPDKDEVCAAGVALSVTVSVAA
jgi:hypothetical protein